MKQYWYDYEQCHGRNRGNKKHGWRCENPPRVPYERRRGELIIPLTCWRHADQENEVQAMRAEALKSLRH